MIRGPEERNGTAHRRRLCGDIDVTFCVSICMLNLLSPSLITLGPLSPAIYLYHSPLTPYPDLCSYRAPLPDSAPPHSLTSHFLEYASPEFPTTPSY